VTSLDGVTPLNLLRNPFPNGFPPATGASAGLLTQVGTNIAAFVQNTVAPGTRQNEPQHPARTPGRHRPGHGLRRNPRLPALPQRRGGRSLNQLFPQHLSLGSQLNELVDNPIYGQITSGPRAAPAPVPAVRERNPYVREWSVELQRPDENLS
jgi:hypothetical protein